MQITKLHGPNSPGSPVYRPAYRLIRGQHGSCANAILSYVSLSTLPTLALFAANSVLHWLLVFPVVLNNFRLQQFAKNLYAYPLPPHTEVINRSAKVGLLGGNGNHCDFEARQYMRTALSQEEIEAYYQGVSLPRSPSILHTWVGGIETCSCFSTGRRMDFCCSLRV